jgi:hypothetical protein
MYLDKARLVNGGRRGDLTCVPSKFDKNGLHIVISLPIREAWHLGRVDLEQVRGV